MATKFSAKERQEYYNNKSKKGATYTNPKTGEVLPVSDFARGIAHERAQTIFKHRKSKKKKIEKLNKEYASTFPIAEYPHEPY